MVEPSEVFARDNGLGLKLQERRPLNGSNSRNTEPEILLKSTNTPPTQRHQSQQRPKERSYPRNSKATSMSKGKAHERARTRSSVAIEDLVQQLVRQKDETKENRRLLHITLEKLEVLQKRAAAAEETRKGETARGVRIAQSTLKVQEQVSKARQDAEVYRLQLERTQQEIQLQQELIRTIEAERDSAEKAAAKARDIARQLNDDRLVGLARQEGRKIGFIEGMRQGRRLAMINRNQAPSTAFIEELNEDAQARQTSRAQPSTPPAKVARRKQEAVEAARKEQEAVEVARKEQEAAEAARKEQEIAEATRKAQEAAEAARKERETAEAIRQRLEAVEAAHQQYEATEAARKELEAAKRAAEKQVRREAEKRERRRQEETLKAERQREAVREAQRELEQQRIRKKEAELEREKEALRQQEAARALEMEAIRKRQEEKEKELEAERERERQLQEEYNNERRQREEREAELAREREKVRELEIEREMTSPSTVSQRSQPKRLEYLPMPEPPPFKNPRPGASTSQPPTPAGTRSPLTLHVPPPNIRPPRQFQSQPNGITSTNPRARSHLPRASQSSQETSFSGSGSASLNNLDIVSFPSAAVIPRGLGSHLSDIPEVASDVGATSVGPGQGNEQSPVEDQGGQTEPVQTSRMEDVERWVQSTAASEVNTPTEPAPPTPTQPLSWPNPSPNGSNAAPGSISSGTIPIEVQPPSRPTSIISPTREDVMLLSPNRPPLQIRSNPSTQPQQQLSPQSPYQHQRRLESEQPGIVPVIPDMLDGDDGIQHLMNFGTPGGFVPVSITRTNTSEGSSRSTAESERRERERRAAGGGVGSRIYRPSVSSSSSTTSGTRLLQMPRMQIYAAPATSASQRQNQTPRQTPRQIYSSMSASGSAGSGLNIYAPPGPSSRTSNIYAPPASSTAPQQMSIHASSTGPGPIPSASVSEIPAVIPSSPRRPASIYVTPASPRAVPFIPPPSQSSSSIHIPAPDSDRSIPVIPPPQRQIYSPNTSSPVIPSSYPYPVSPSSRLGGLPSIGRATPRSYDASLPGMGVNMRTPGGSVAPLPTRAGWGSATATPRSWTGVLPSSRATPRAPPMVLEDDEEDEEDDQDLETRRNTEANRSGRGGMTLQIPPMNY